MGKKDSKGKATKSKADKSKADKGGLVAVGNSAEHDELREWVRRSIVLADAEPDDADLAVGLYEAVSELKVERNKLAVEIDRDRHDWQPAANGECRVEACAASTSQEASVHRTAALVLLAEPVVEE